MLVDVESVDGDEVADHSTVNHGSMSDEQEDAEDSIVSAAAAEDTGAVEVILMKASAADVASNSICDEAMSSRSDSIHSGALC